MLSTWPYLGIYPPLISADGSYFAYIISNQPLNANTLVIQNASNTWKKEKVSPTLEDYFFSSDNKRLWWKSADTLFAQVLGQNEVDSIAPITAFSTPAFNKGVWVAYQFKNAPDTLVVRNLLTGQQLQLNNVIDYLFSNTGASLLLKAPAALQCLNLENKIITTIWSATGNQKIASYAFDKQGSQIAFMVQEQIHDTINNSIWCYKAGWEKAILKVSNHSPSLRNAALSISSPAQFSANGNWLFFGLQEPQKKEIPSLGAAQVSIWSYKDKTLNPQLSPHPQERQGIIAVSSTDYIYISGKDEQLETPIPSTITGNFIVVRNNRLAPDWWPHLPPPSYWLVSLENGVRTLLIKESKAPVWQFSFSPQGKWLIYWDSQKAAYISYGLHSKVSCNITKSLPQVSREADYVDGFYNSVYPQPIDEPAAWYANDEALLIYDRYDIWKLDPAGAKPPINITNAYGAKRHIKLRLVYQPIILAGKETVLLTGFNTHSKHNGFFQKQLYKKGPPDLLTMGPYTYYLTASQKPQPASFGDGLQPLSAGTGNQQHWIVQRAAATAYPNYFYSSDLKTFRSLTNLQPQKAYNWLTAELITWRQLDGALSQGILYKPESFDPKKKYPLIFNYYEMLSHRLYGFPYPELTNANIDIPWFVSRGYLVFTPDIHFSAAAASQGGKTIGEAAYNSIVSAARHLSALPYVNSKKMAIQGHSFGGGITNYLITRTHTFAAACSAAGIVSDQISAYLGIATVNGFPPRECRLRNSETGHDRLGATLWQRPDLYIRSSPVFKANQIATPLLIMHNQNDGVSDWGQSAELYMALRRLGKKVWMLQYEGEGHALLQRKNAADFTIRLTQFFDYYLKDAAPPAWMSQEAPAK